jgi:hypothetical protein
MCVMSSTLLCVCAHVRELWVGWWVGWGGGWVGFLLGGFCVFPVGCFVPFLEPKQLTSGPVELFGPRKHHLFVKIGLW